jgi:hypothetical protein
LKKKAQTGGQRRRRPTRVPAAVAEIELKLAQLEEQGLSADKLVAVGRSGGQCTRLRCDLNESWKEKEREKTKIVGGEVEGRIKHGWMETKCLTESVKETAEERSTGRTEALLFDLTDPPFLRRKIEAMVTFETYEGEIMQKKKKKITVVVCPRRPPFFLPFLVGLQLLYFLCSAQAETIKCNLQSQEQ